MKFMLGLFILAALLSPGSELGLLSMDLLKDLGLDGTVFLYFK